MRQLTPTWSMTKKAQKRSYDCIKWWFRKRKKRPSPLCRKGHPTNGKTKKLS